MPVPASNKLTGPLRILNSGYATLVLGLVDIYVPECATEIKGVLITRAGGSSAPGNLTTAQFADGSGTLTIASDDGNDDGPFYWAVFDLISPDHQYP